LISKFAIDAIFLVLPLFLLAASFAFFTLFAAVAHDRSPADSLDPRLDGHGCLAPVYFPGAVEGRLDAGRDILAADVIEKARLLKEFRWLFHRSAEQERSSRFSESFANDSMA
jgi:hypothetical protein